MKIFGEVVQEKAGDLEWNWLGQLLSSVYQLLITVNDTMMTGTNFVDKRRIFFLVRFFFFH